MLKCVVMECSMSGGRVVCVWARVILRVEEEGFGGVCARYLSRSHSISVLKGCLGGRRLVSSGVV